MWMLKSLSEFFHPISLISILSTTIKSHTTHLVLVWLFQIHICFSKNLTLSVLASSSQKGSFTSVHVLPCLLRALPQPPHNKQTPFFKGWLQTFPTLRHKRLFGHSVKYYKKLKDQTHSPELSIVTRKEIWSLLC